jgi:moderate conductance mechanosensitive channel
MVGRADRRLRLRLDDQQILLALGVDDQVRRLVSLGFGLVLFGIAITIIWRQRRLADQEGAAAAPRSRTPEVLLTVAAVAIWGLWLVGAMPMFWLALVAMALPAAVRVLQRGVNHLLRPADAPAAESAVPSLVAVCLERGLRAVLLIGAVYFLAWAWGIDAARMAAGESLGERLLRGLLHAAVIVLVADFAWHVLKTVIDRKLVERHGSIAAGSEETRRQARLRTLLPILATWRWWCSS